MTGPREQITDAMVDCLTVYGEKAGMFVIGTARFWSIMGQLRRTAGGATTGHNPTRKQVMFGLPILVTAARPDLLLAIPESQVEAVRRQLRGS